MLIFYRSLIPALWVIWLVGWIISGLSTKRVVRTEGLASRVIHGTLLLAGFILLEFPRAGGPWLAARIYPQSLWSFWIGSALVAVGLGFASWARVHLAGNWSGTVTLKQDHTLTRSGPYRFVRHPIYTGLLTAILGTAIALAEWRGLVAFGLITASFLWKINTEERFMTAAFGDAYRRYRAEVPALVPWPRGRF